MVCPAGRSPRAPPRSWPPSERATAGALPVNACGGIFTAADAQACLDAGAATVQVYTGLIYEGPAVAGRILAGLRTGVTSPLGP